MDNVYRILVFSVPFLVSFIAFAWLSRKTLAVQNKVVRVLAFILIVVGIIFTAWQLMLSFPNALRDDAFNFKVIFFNILFMVAISIILAFGTPEEQPNKNGRLN